MKYFFVLILFYSSLANAQESVPLTEAFKVEGQVKISKTFSINDLKNFSTVSVDSLRIYNHKMEYRKTIRKLKLVPLKDILKEIEFDVPGPRWLSEVYITCIASDNYNAVFSWNELFNTHAGNKIGIIVEENDTSIERSDDRIALISPHDIATGRRYVKGVSKIIITRVK